MMLCRPAGRDHWTSGSGGGGGVGATSVVLVGVVGVSGHALGRRCGVLAGQRVAVLFCLCFGGAFAAVAAEAGHE